ncbi:hypothetical protein [Microbulbifer taiwanensis]|uniref:hypothetical protein n=1 Tax=Microbulbifer taiwanensis TaxID=986746 RepID=UPI00360B32D1
MRRPGLRRTSPLLARVKPSSRRSSVVLPAPLGPMTVTISPGCSARVMFCSSCRPATSSPRLSAVISGSGWLRVKSPGVAGMDTCGRA